MWHSQLRLFREERRAQYTGKTYLGSGEVEEEQVGGERAGLRVCGDGVAGLLVGKEKKEKRIKKILKKLNRWETVLGKVSKQLTSP